MLDGKIDGSLPQKRHQALGLVQLTGAQFLQGDNKGILGQVRSQLTVTRALEQDELDTCGITFKQFGLGGSFARPDPVHQVYCYLGLGFQDTLSVIGCYVLIILHM